MEIIRSYVENAFAAYAKTSQMQNLKEEILSNMEEKYLEMKRQGHSENEAIGAVISEFGNIDELVRELGVSPAGAEKEKAVPSLPPLSRNEAELYLAQKKKGSLLIAVGVMLCILSPVPAILVEGLRGIDKTAVGGLSVSALFILVAVAVFFFIIAGMRLQKLERIAARPICDAGLREELKQRQNAFLPKFTVSIAAGVVLCILSVIPVVLIEELRLGGVLPENIGPALLLAIVSIGVFLFVYAGMRRDAYLKLLHEDSEGRPVEWDGCGKAIKKSRAEEIVDIVASIYWCLITAAYLLWSFLTFDWGRSWIIWPIAGILFGAVAGIVKACVRDDAR